MDGRTLTTLASGGLPGFLLVLSISHYVVFHYCNCEFSYMIQHIMYESRLEYMHDYKKYGNKVLAMYFISSTELINPTLLLPYYPFGYTLQPCRVYGFVNSVELMKYIASTLFPYFL